MQAVMIRHIKSSGRVYGATFGLGLNILMILGPYLIPVSHNTGPPNLAWFTVDSSGGY